jgi:hypothetical protein
MYETVLDSFMILKYAAQEFTAYYIKYIHKGNFLPHFNFGYPKPTPSGITLNYIKILFPNIDSNCAVYLLDIS